jgi:methylated-DNA-[protein]-cysteine S-methyltransferase
VAAALTLAARTFPTPLGPFTVIVSPDGVLATTIDDPGPLLADLAARLRAAIEPQGRGLARVGRELDSYFSGRLRAFETPVDLRLAPTSLSRRILEVVHRIPYGEMWTYGDVAAMAGRPGAARAAGGALRRCPVELFVPCHRVVPAGPGLGSYGGDEDRRAFLLRLEGAI